MKATLAKAAAEFRKPLIRFLGPRRQLWKDQDPHHGIHPLTPTNMVKKVAPPSTRPASSTPAAAPKSSTGTTIEFSELPAKYRYSPLTAAEIEAIETGGATLKF